MIDIEVNLMVDEIDIDKSMLELAKRAIECVMTIEGIENAGEVDVMIVDAERIRSLNKEFRGKDEVTDVLSFPQYDHLLENGIGEDYLVLGDIVICAQRAIEQAKEFNHGIERELAYLVVHSIYHLLGFDHMDENEKIKMREKEEIAMTALNISR